MVEFVFTFCNQVKSIQDLVKSTFFRMKEYCIVLCIETLEDIEERNNAI
jgi:hypothetical protein